MSLILVGLPARGSGVKALTDAVLPRYLTHPRSQTPYTVTLSIPTGNLVDNPAYHSNHRQDVMEKVQLLNGMLRVLADELQGTRTHISPLPHALPLQSAHHVHAADGPALSVCSP